MRNKLSTEHVYKDERPETWPNINYEPQIQNLHTKKPKYICVPSNAELTRRRTCLCAVLYMV